MYFNYLEGIIFPRVFARHTEVKILTSFSDFVSPQVQNSCWDLYKTMCHIRKEPVSVAEWDTEHQLTYITRRIQQLSKVTSIAKKKSEKHQPASNAQTATSSIQLQ